MRKIFIIISVLFLTGCTVNYNLEIKNEEFFENINGIIGKNEFDTPDDYFPDLFIYELLYNDQAPYADETGVYEKEINELDDEIEFNYNFNYQNNLKKSKILNDCYENVIVEDSEELYVISLTGKFTCMMTDTINVNVKTDYEVINSNAKSHYDNVYHWELSKDSTDIEMTIYKNKKPETKTSPNYIRIAGLVIFGVLSLISYIIYKMKNKSIKK